MLYSHTEQLIRLLNEKNSNLSHELKEAKKENRKLKQHIRELEQKKTEDCGKDVVE